MLMPYSEWREGAHSFQGEKNPDTQQKLCNYYLLDTEENAYVICYIELYFVTGYSN